MNIDLSVNKRLIDIDLSRNKLESLDLSNQIELESLGIGRNNISHIDLEENRELKSLFMRDNNIKELDFDYRSLKYLDISNNSFNLKTLPELDPLGTYLYIYYPQKTFQIAPDLNMVDLRSQLEVKSPNGEEHISVYLWKTIDGTLLNKDSDYNENNGIFTFVKPISAVYCEIRNDVFPDLILRTNPIDIVIPK